MVVSQATLGPLVRATAITAFRASIHNNFYSFYKYVFAQRANDVKTIAQRHKIGNWFVWLFFFMKRLSYRKLL